MKKHGILLSALITLLSSGFQPGAAQTGKEFILLNRTESRAGFVTADHLGNIYTLEGSRLTCLDSNLKVRSTYSNMADGNFTSVDVSDPLKILLFSRDFTRIRFLDQNLAQRSDPVELSTLGYPGATLACTSYESGFWIWDASGLQAVRFNSRGEQVQTSGNVASLAGYAPEPVFMAESGNLLYLADSVHGILLFDRYGAYLRTLPAIPGFHLHFLRDRIVAVGLKCFYVLREDGLSAAPVAYPELPVTDACVMHGRLCLLNGTALLVYKIRTFVP